MPEDLKVSQISSSPLPLPFRGLHSPRVRKHCQIIFTCYFWKSSIEAQNTKCCLPRWGDGAGQSGSWFARIFWSTESPQTSCPERIWLFRLKAYKHAATTNNNDNGYLTQTGPKHIRILQMYIFSRFSAYNTHLYLRAMGPKKRFLKEMSEQLLMRLIK